MQRIKTSNEKTLPTDLRTLLEKQAGKTDELSKGRGRFNTIYIQSQTATITVCVDSRF